MKLVLPLLASVAVAAVLNLSACSRTPSFPSTWLDLSLRGVDAPPDKHGLVSATLEAYGILGRFSVSMLKVESASGQVKFLPDTPFEPLARPLAYNIKMSAADYVQMEDMPLAYPDRMMTPGQVKGGRYDFVFEFTLRDREGFPLATLKSNSDLELEQIQSGVTTEFLGVTTNAVSPYVAAATDSVELAVVVLRGGPIPKDDL